MCANSAVGPAPCAASRQSGRHGEPLRGLTSTSASDLAQGRFGRMFRSLPAAQFGANEPETEANLKKLAALMLGDPKDKPKDGFDSEESGIPALYTYFGQFIDHDITFDPASSLQKRNDPAALIDYRTPALDLDNVYGRGPDDQPYLYIDPPDGNGAMHFLEGSSMDGGGDLGAKDLPRNGADPARALIGDPRNDENAIVSQLQALFLRFHNRFASAHTDLCFEQVQQQVRFHYQYVVLNDFLPRLVNSTVLQALQSDGRYDSDKLKFFHWKNEPFMPVEFSVAAYRLGHSMVRPGYRLNNNDETLLPIFGPPKKSLGGFGARNQHWGIDWARFVDTQIRRNKGSGEIDKQRLQFAYKIDTSLVNPLGDVSSVVGDPPPSLPLRNLLRGWRLGLPSGQAVAHRMHEDPIPDEKILIGSATGEAPQTPIVRISKAFTKNCPLWTYILTEARYNSEKITVPVAENESPTPETEIIIDTPKLGPVGGRIVAEVLLGLMFGDRHSLLSQRPNWLPESGPDFRLRDFVKYALGQ